MQPTDTKQVKPIKQVNGSPIKKLCTTIVLSGTADDQSTSNIIKSMVTEKTAIPTGPVPLFLVPKRISAEFQTHGGYISDIAIHRTGNHIYCITLTKTPKQECNQGQGQGQELNKNQGGTDAGMSISTGPVPLSLVAKRIFAEIQAHGGYISDIAIHRTAYHTYCITLTKTPKPGCDRRQGQELNKNQGGADAD
ncbi:hypothetical protein L0665_10165 [Methanogenium marinum]|uniref:Uncharacterized protein n=1 Tax=Methanogenium marinum TaxID=348610 RepID=A0A9Q4KU87_9EURY|nr:hypothetical protein [Methanogenium marinum]MDE4908971.1 hypothetical protein [Methanogenium marinum]